jgi:hypothetical protein
MQNGGRPVREGADAFPKKLAGEQPKLAALQQSWLL